MIDAKAFGLELAGIVKAQLDPIAVRLEALERRLDTLPMPRDLGEELADLKSAVDAIGVAPDVPDFDALVSEEVERQVSALPAAKNGEPGNDGIGLAGAMIDRDGNLIITATNGIPYNLGKVVGKDGEPGKDGFSLSDFDATLMDDGRTVLLSFERGEQSFKVELGIPVMIYRGVHREGTYRKGDTVTWGGSLWHCDADETTEKPDSSAKHWTLAAKKGRDGKDGTLKEVKPSAPIRVGLPAEAR
ncbi:hypothetical protein IB277_31090 [Ensifer sp. ENS07]|uniref:hypothetical protein n=1 Tax=Ensifer sp. ENS07 TaxID=2769274 RepID=UPI00178376B2|nr:hypothetical protein [Ensifer sp. ENS07]MBD9640745.1 hypothetical protein [Ensifer sp. ENS07]